MSIFESTMKRPFAFAPLLAAFLLLIGAGCRADDADQHARQEAVAERGAEVMPFDLEKTVHVFEDRDDGGLQQVVVRDTADAEQVALIRAHLQEEAARFARGDFSDPAAIHGDDMPGLQTLADHADRIEVAYADLPDGAQIRYTTSDTTLVAAIHAWFAAQRSDHGRHARHHQGA